MAIREVCKTSLHPARTFNLRKLLTLEHDPTKWRLVLEPLSNCSASANGKILQDPQAFIQRAVQAAVEEKLRGTCTPAHASRAASSGLPNPLVKY
jgi:hypothetical protein